MGLDLTRPAEGTSPDDRPPSALRNIGPAVERSLAAAGIASVGDLRAVGADAAYARLLAAGARPHFILFYVLEMALQGRPWTDCQGEEKAALRRRFDAIVASGGPGRRDAFETMMDEIGIVDG